MNFAPRLIAFSFITTLTVAACGGKATPVAMPVTSSPTSADTGGDVDCRRIDDPAYREELTAQGIEPDSIDCGEHEDTMPAGDGDGDGDGDASGDLED